jgi:hypothetical protein
VRDYTRELARTNLTLETHLRAYRLVCGDVITRWAAKVAERDIPDPAAIAVVQYRTTYALEWLDAMREQVAQEYRAEADRFAPAANNPIGVSQSSQRWAPNHTVGPSTNQR